MKKFDGTIIEEPAPVVVQKYFTTTQKTTINKDSKRASTPFTIEAGTYLVDIRINLEAKGTGVQDFNGSFIRCSAIGQIPSQYSNYNDFSDAFGLGINVTASTPFVYELHTCGIIHLDQAGRIVPMANYTGGNVASCDITFINKLVKLD